ncbi:DUF4157 domain-containing protein [Scytonema sp. UIC 10036]|uniref:eCIS core domain-containing protein n=1 Tax=Scytonema sp. UIC 10036 TaxID=2304196 RepID=UPI0012DAA499|nr:DUF4157 domain-containing protein [Scytonema sp. UIC 10036]MUG97774.1 DUF4157 domain-containing protein [Scytonema sp. UIC 10036]
MKTTENKSSYSQQYTTADRSSVKSEWDRAFFSNPPSEQTPFFRPGAASWVQTKSIGERSSFFSPSPTPTIQRKCKTCEAEEQSQVDGVELPTVQLMPAFESEGVVQSKRVSTAAIASPTVAPQTHQGAETKELEQQEAIAQTPQIQMIPAFSSADDPEDGNTNYPPIQFSLTIGQRGDAYEREADAIADRVAAMPRSTASDLATKNSNTPDSQQVNRKQSVGMRSLMRQADGSPTPTPKNLETSLQQARGNGSPLNANTRTEMEGAFDADFSRVQIHTGREAATLNKSLGARAFTHGNEIFFNSGEYQPQSQQGRHLLAHELTHTLQQGASIQRKPVISSTSNDVQMLLPDFILEEANDYARNIPGYVLFTVIIEYNPLTGNRVERNAINLLEGFMGLVPFGTAIFDKLREHGILQAAFEWVVGELGRLDLSISRIERIIEAAGDEIGYDIWNADEVLERHFIALYNDVEAFARSLVDHIIQLIKDAALNLAEGLLNDNQAWALIKKVLHYDPLRDEPVDASTAEILADFLRLIGKEQELEQMQERGTLEETAAWLDTQLGTFMALLGEFQSLIASAIDAIRSENLTNLTTNLESLANQVIGFLQGVWEFASTVALKVLELIKDALLGWLSSYANDIPGYHLLTVILNRDPFTNEVVPRTVTNIIRGFMSLIPGGEQQFQQMQETGVIPRAAERIETMMSDLGISWEFIQNLFLDIWNSFTIDDLINPIDAFIRILTEFEEPLNRLFTFVIEVIKVVLELLLEMMNFPSDILARIINNAIQALDDIQQDPVGFLINMLQAVKLGFEKFFDNIVQHLLGGVTDWLFAEVRKAGIEPPTEITLESILDLVLQILGISMDQIWQKLGDRIGQENIDRIRGAIDRLTGIWTFVRDVQERGVAAIWEYIQSQISNLWDMVLEQISNWITERVIERVMTRLLSMLDPTGIMAVVNGFISFFNAVQSAIEYFREMLMIVDDYVSTIASVARGDVEPGAVKMEQGLANSIPVAIGFLANQVGLGNLGDQIAEIITGIRELVDRALDWLINRAVSAGQALLRSLGMGTEDPTPAPGSEARRHEHIADSIYESLRRDVQDNQNIDELLTEKRAQAQQLHELYAPQLESGLVLIIELHKVESSEGRPGLELEVIIRPNTTERGYRIYHRAGNLSSKVDELIEQSLDELTDVLYSGDDREEGIPNNVVQAETLARGIQRTLGRIQRDYGEAVRDSSNNIIFVGNENFFVDQVRNNYVYPRARAVSATIIQVNGKITTAHEVRGFLYSNPAFRTVTVGQLHSLLTAINSGASTPVDSTAMLIASLVAEPFRYGPSHITNLLLLSDYGRHGEAAFAAMSMTTGGTDPTNSRNAALDPNGRGTIPEDVRLRQIEIVKSNNELISRLENFYEENYERLRDTEMVRRFRNIIRDYLNRRQ